MRKPPRHMPHVSTKREPYWCPHCATPFRYFDDLHTHARREHRCDLPTSFGPYTGAATN